MTVLVFFTHNRYMAIVRDYTAELRRIMNEPVSMRLPLVPHHVVLAVRVVKQLFPPKTTDCVFRLLTALNLLNAAVKLPWGRQMVGYRFIKGYVSLVLLSVINWQVADVDYYWDAVERIVYFRVFGIQLGFHYIPFTDTLRALLATCNDHVQHWDGIRLQQVAVEVFLLGNPEQAAVPVPAVPPRMPPECFRSPLPLEERVFRQQPQSEPKGHCRHGPSRRLHFCHSLRTLHVALTFRFSSSGICLFYRRKDRCRIPVGRYRGDNYAELISHLSASCPELYRRPERTLTKGCLYYVSPRLRIESLLPSRRQAFLAKNCYLLDSRRRCCHNLCVTYGIARYLTLLFPSLRFINLLNFNRVRVRRRYYSHQALLRVPLHSQARTLKVWMVAGGAHALRYFDVGSLPPALLVDYHQTPDYYQEFEVVCRNGSYGVCAYRRHYLLKPVFRRVVISGNYAFATRHDGKVALYALQEECFKSGFIYDRIWHVPSEHTTYGQIGSAVVVIYRLHPGEMKNER